MNHDGTCKSPKRGHSVIDKQKNVIIIIIYNNINIFIFGILLLIYGTSLTKPETLQLVYYTHSS